MVDEATLIAPLSGMTISLVFEIEGVDEVLDSEELRMSQLDCLRGIGFARITYLLTLSPSPLVVGLHPRHIQLRKQIYHKLPYEVPSEAA